MWTRQVTAPAAAGRAWLHKYPRVGSAPLGIYILQTERTPKRPSERTNPHSFGGVPMIGLIVTALLQTFCALDQEDDSGYAFHCGEAGGIAAATVAFGVRALELCDDISDAYEDSDLDFMRYILRYTPDADGYSFRHRDRRSRPGILSSPGLGIPTTGTRPTGTRRHSPPRRRHHRHTRFHILHHRRPLISRPPKARRQNENRRCGATESSQIRWPPELVFRRFS